MTPTVILNFCIKCFRDLGPERSSLRIRSASASRFNGLSVGQYVSSVVMRTRWFSSHLTFLFTLPSQQISLLYVTEQMIEKRHPSIGRQPVISHFEPLRY
jgi:hypothetical protein